MILSFAKAMGEFGATITFVSNIPGETQTLPSAIYTFTQVPGGDAGALRLTLISIAIAMAALVASEVLARRGQPAAWTSHDARGRRPPPARRLRARRGLRERRPADRAVRPLRLGQDHARQPDRRAACGPTRAGSPSTAACWSTPPARVFVPPHRRRIGYVFQDARLFPHLTVRQNLRYGRCFTPRGRALRRLRPRSSSCSASAPLLDRRPGAAVGRREAARRDRPGAARQPAAAPDGRAARLARRGAQGRDPALHRAAARRGRRSRSSMSATRSPRWRGSRPTWWCWPAAGSSARGPAADVLARLDLLPRRRSATRPARWSSSMLVGAGRGLRAQPAALGRRRLAGAADRRRRSARGCGCASGRATSCSRSTGRRGISALNVLPATVRGGRGGAGRRTRSSTLDCGGDRLLARITRQSVAALGLAPGRAGLRDRQGGDLRPRQRAGRRAAAAR